MWLLTQDDMKRYAEQLDLLGVQTTSDWTHQWELWTWAWTSLMRGVKQRIWEVDVSTTDVTNAEVNCILTNQRGLVL
jgi:hypothetical protein